MMGFVTDNSTYRLDLSKRKISGGVFKDQWKEYEQATIIIGLPAEVRLSDDTVWITSTVRRYI